MLARTTRSGRGRPLHIGFAWVVLVFSLVHEAPAEQTWLTSASKPYQGTMIRGVTEDQPASRYIAEVLAPAFEKETGIHVEVEVVPWETMFDNSIRDMALGTGYYDFVYIEQDIIYAYLAQNYLTNLSRFLVEHRALASPTFDFADFTSYLDYFRAPTTGDVYGVPIESFLRIYVYRKDLFDDPEIKAAFKAEYGYPLGPAQSVSQYRDIAAFFTEWGKKQGIDLWGTTIHASPSHVASFYELFESVLPMFGVYDWGVDRTTRRASIARGGTMNSDAAKQALTFWLKLLRYAPPEAFGSTWVEGPLTISSGRVAQGLLYGEHIVNVATDQTASKVAGKIGTALPPLAPGVLEAAKAGTGYIGYYDGGAFGIPHSSRKKEAAALWLQYLGQPSVQVPWTLATGRITHTATLQDPAVIQMDAQLGGYYSLVQQYGALFAGAPPFAEHAAIREVVAPYIYAVVKRELSPAEALDQAAEAVDGAMSALH